MSMDIDCNTSPGTAECALFRALPAVIQLDPFSPFEKWGMSLSRQYSGDATQPSQSDRTYVLLIDSQLVVVKLTAPQDTETPGNTLVAQPAALPDRLNWIKDRLALSITQMAELFSVTRKSVYDWYEGAEPRTTTSSRMETLIDVLAGAPAEADLRRLKAVWNIAVSGQSFRTVFNDDKLDTATLQTALTAKLNELSPRMAATTRVRNSHAQLGVAHLTELDRHTDFS